MSAIDNGGSAFPVTFKQCISHDNDGRPIYSEDTFPGMTIRDYMAVHASEADIIEQANQLRVEGHFACLPDGWRVTARYMHADAMIAERSKAHA